MHRHLTILILGLAAAGCANNSQFRNLASRTGTVVEGLNRGTAEFIESQTTLNNENADRLDMLGLMAQGRATRARRQELAWTAGNVTQPLAAYQAATALTPDALVASLNPSATRHPGLSDADALEAYTGSRDALVALSRRPSAYNILTGLLTYAGAVQAAHDELTQDAEDDAEATSNATDTADEGIQP
jgi:hypothetical protein